MAPRPRNGGVLERARLALILSVVLAGGCRHRAGPPAFAIPGDSGRAVTVEVINTTGKPGLARSGMRLLRSAGVDVVNYFTSNDGSLDSTRILVRRGDSATGQRVRTILQVGRVALQPDSARLVDVSVFLGVDFAARTPFEFHP